jgi:hypothetical protein
MTMNKDNQQRSPDEGNVQRLSRKGVETKNLETENTLPCNDGGEDIVQDLRKLVKKPGRDIEREKNLFLLRASKKYGNRFTFDLSNYNGSTKNKVRIKCSIHGWFDQKPDVFLLKNCVTGCKRCGLAQKNKTKTKSYEDFLIKAKQMHSNRYEYPNSAESHYCNRKSRVTVTCPKHGSFVKSAQKHLSGQGCWECKVQDLINTGVLIGDYSESRFEKNPNLKTKPACLYYLSINNGQLYKIGISTSLATRLRGIRCSAKNTIKKLDLLWSVEDTLYNCFKKEQKILEKYSNFRVKTDWSTELFNFNVLPLKLTNLD